MTEWNIDLCARRMQSELYEVSLQPQDEGGFTIDVPRMCPNLVNRPVENLGADLAVRIARSAQEALARHFHTLKRR